MCTAYMNVIILFFLIIAPLCKTDSSQQEIYLHQGESISRKGPDFQIYCYSGKPKSIIYLWQSVSLEINLPSDNFIYYEGATADIVRQEYHEKHSSWGIDLFLWKQKYFKLNPFKQSCIGIETREPCTIYLNVIRVDYWKVIFLITGAILFFSAKRLAKNVLFYYICGISLGICTSFLILIYFLSKLFPRKPMMYGAVICGWTVGVYLVQLLFENLRTIFLSYRNYVAWYAGITGLISFIICYRWGPVTDKRTQNIIQWSLQLFGIAAVFQSSQFEEVAMAQILIICFIYNFPQKWLSKSKSYWKKKFPPKIRQLTNAEYYQQGVTETSKALDELRDFCSSPKCNQWKTALKLKDVKRFASFIEGNSHLSDDEILEYETGIHATDLTDDEDEQINTLTDEEL